MPGFDPAINVLNVDMDHAFAAHTSNKIKRVYIGDMQHAVVGDLDSGSTHSFWGADEAATFIRQGGQGRIVKLQHPFKIRIANRQLERCRTALIATLLIPRIDGRAPTKIVDAMIYLVDAPWAALLIGWDA